MAQAPAWLAGGPQLDSQDNYVTQDGSLEDRPLGHQLCSPTLSATVLCLELKGVSGDQKGSALPSNAWGVGRASSALEVTGAAMALSGLERTHSTKRGGVNSVVRL